MRSLSIKAREGDFIETFEGLIFDVKGLVHPPDRVIAYLRYFEDHSGERMRGGRRYAKVYSLNERDRILRERYPRYICYDHVFGEWLESVPNRLVKIHHEPLKKTLELLKEPRLNDVEAQALRLIKTIHDFSSVPLENLGISGSILVDLCTPRSDMDIVVYGRRNCLLAHESLRTLLSEGKESFSSYGFSDLRRLYEFRSRDTWMPFREFCEVERRKVSQGKFSGRDFFVRFILDWEEVNERYGDRLYRNVGYMRIKAKIEDDKDAIFTPSRYGITEVKVLEGASKIPPPVEIVSFRGRFCEQARKGEWVAAQGKVEKVIERDGNEFYRLVLGAKPSDFMMIKSSP